MDSRNSTTRTDRHLTKCDEIWRSSLASIATEPLAPAGGSSTSSVQDEHVLFAERQAGNGIRKRRAWTGTLDSNHAAAGVLVAGQSARRRGEALSICRQARHSLARVATRTSRRHISQQKIDDDLNIFLLFFNFLINLF